MGDTVFLHSEKLSQPNFDQRFSSISSNKCPQGLIYFDAIKGRIIRDSDYKMVALIY